MSEIKNIYSEIEKAEAYLDFLKKEIKEKQQDNLAQTYIYSPTALWPGVDRYEWNRICIELDLLEKGNRQFEDIKTWGIFEHKPIPQKARSGFCFLTYRGFSMTAKSRIHCIDKNNVNKTIATLKKDFDTTNKILAEFGLKLKDEIFDYFESLYLLAGRHSSQPRE